MDIDVKAGVRVLRLAAVVAALGVFGGACAQAQSDPGVATAATGQPSAGQSASPNTGDRNKWINCLSEHGVPIVGGKPDYQFDKRKLQPALQACQQYEPVQDIKPSVGTTKDIEQWRKWARCMRDQGIDMGDPDPATGGEPQVRTTRDSIDKLEKAEQACKSQAPAEASP